MKLNMNQLINMQNKKIYRVTNEPHYSTVNGSGRFAYDFENKKKTKKEAFEKLKTLKNKN